MIRVEEQDTADGLYDAPFAVVLSGWEPHSHVTIDAQLDTPKRFRSTASVTIDASGTGRLEDGAMLLCCLAPETLGGRYNHGDLDAPVTLLLRAHTRTMTADVCRLQRWFKHPSVRRVPVDVVVHNGRRILGSLFVPFRGADERRPLGLVEIGGSAGGLLEWRASMYASRARCVVLCLAWFGFKELPSSMAIDVEYVLDAVAWLANHEAVAPGGVVVQGLSKGSELAFLAGVHSPHCRAVIIISGYACVMSPSFLMSGVSLPFGNFNVAAIAIDENGVVDFTNMTKDSFMDAAAQIPVEKLRAQALLLLAGSADRNLPAAHWVGVVCERLGRAQWGGRVEAHVFPGTGHLIEPPSPHCDVGYSPAIQALAHYGGTDVPAHAAGRRAAWHVHMRFLESLVPRARL